MTDIDFSVRSGPGLAYRGSTLVAVEGNVIARLDEEYRNERAVYRAHAPQFR